MLGQVVERREAEVPRIDVETILTNARQQEVIMLSEAEPLPLTVKQMRLMVNERIESSPEAIKAVERTRLAIMGAQLGLSSKAVFIMGQCAPDSRLFDDGRVPALEVPLALHDHAQNFSDSLIHLPRVCWKKPRSSEGSPGLYHQLNGAAFALQEIYLPLIEKGVPFAYELLDADDPLQNAAAYAWLGARSIGHNSLWYAMAANPSCPVGLKNGEGGGFSKINDVARAIRAQTAVNLALTTGTEAQVTTPGNKLINAIYRGGELNQLGLTKSNEIRIAFQQSYLEFCRAAYQAHTRVLLDCSHSNAKLFSGGKRSEQGQLDCFDAFEELILENPVIIAAGEFDAPRDITVLDLSMGAMAEVNWLPGRNESGQPALAGRSDVDACLAIEQGFELQKRIAALYKNRDVCPPLWLDHPAYTLS